MQLLTEPILRRIANHFGGLESVGIVDFASRLCQIPRTFVGAIGQTMVPAFARATHASAIEQRRLFDHGRAMVVPLSVSMMAATIGGAYLARSDEHTSALQSLMHTSYAVFCLK